jgi:hypothetical protein
MGSTSSPRQLGQERAIEWICIDVVRLMRVIGLQRGTEKTCHVMAASCDQGNDGTAYRSVANPKGNIMKTALVASLLVATSFAASAMYGDNNHEAYQVTASGPGKTRAEVIAELQVAKAAGQINRSDAEMREAERMSTANTRSNLTRPQVQQEVIALRQQGLLNIQVDH